MQADALDLAKALTIAREIEILTTKMKERDKSVHGKALHAQKQA